jgi:hypothetical protein
MAAVAAVAAVAVVVQFFIISVHQQPVTKYRSRPRKK